MRLLYAGFLISLTYVAVTTVELNCEYSFDKLHGYTCRAQNLIVLNNKTAFTSVKGNHTKGWKNDHVLRLTIWNQTIHYLPINITKFFPNIRTLQVKNSQLKSLAVNVEFYGRLLLRKMLLGYNELQSIPVTYFWHFCKLETLSLYHNKLNSIPLTAFKDLINIKALSLNGNQLRHLHSNLFDNCTNLQFIDLQNNLLDSIDGQLFAKNIKLRRIDLRNNQIHAIGDDFMATLVDIKYAMFQGNVCIDCSFPEVSAEQLFELFVVNCTLPYVETSSTIKPTKAKPRKKLPHEKIKWIYYENCQWILPTAAGFRYFK